MKVNFVASWRPDAEKFRSKADAQKVAEEIYALGEKVETKEILDMARDESKEIHKLIEWDDSKAAEKYRLEQVVNIMHDLHIVKININGAKKPEKIGVPVRMYYSLKGETGYRPMPLIVQDNDLHDKLLMTAKSELNAFMTKYASLTELEPIFKAIKEFNKAS